MKTFLLEGIYSHLSSADENNAIRSKKYLHKYKDGKFQELLKQINVERNNISIIHLANSAGMLLNKDFHFDMVRVGLSMYGYSPLSKIEQKFVA